MKPPGKGPTRPAYSDTDAGLGGTEGLSPEGCGPRGPRVRGEPRHERGGSQPEGAREGELSGMNPDSMSPEDERDRTVGITGPIRREHRH